MINPNTIGVIGISVSVYVCAKIAWARLQAHPRLFTVLALLALSWAILISYYSNNTCSQYEIFLALNSFLLVYIGGILSLEASGRRTGNNIIRVSIAQNLSIWLLLLIIGAISIPFFDLKTISEFAEGIKNTFAEGIKNTIVVIVLTLVGYFALWHGYIDLFGGGGYFWRGFYNLIVTLVISVYCCCRAYHKYVQFETDQMMTLEWAVTFAALKIILTLLLAYRLSIETMDEEERSRSVRTFAFDLIPM